EKIRENLVVVLFFKIDRVARDIELVAYAADIFGVFFRRAKAVLVGVVPVFHENADDVIALFFEQQGRHGRVNAAGHADDDAGFAVVHLPSFLWSKDTGCSPHYTTFMYHNKKPCDNIESVWE